MKNKIILISVIIIISLIGYFAYQNLINKELGFDFYFPGEIDLYFSDLNAAQIPELDLGDSLDFETPEVEIKGVESLGETPVPEISLNNSMFNFSFPLMNISMPKAGPSQSGQQAAPPAGQWQPNPTDCASFSAAPNCSFVPPQNQDMCEQCKAAGY